MWIGYIGAGSPETLRSTVPARADVATGMGFGLACLPGVTSGPIVRSETHLRAVSGTVESGCSAAIDTDTCEITLTCDRFGLHGIYWMRLNGVVWFSSDARLLYRASAPQRSIINPAGIYGYLAFSYVPTPETLYPEIHKLPAGGTLRFSRWSEEVVPPVRWLSDQPLTTTEEEAEQTLNDLLEHAVQSRITSGDKIGVLLSGGLDSSLIAALLKQAGVDVECFTLDFGELANGGETELARQVAQHLGCPLTIVPAMPSDIRAMLPTAAHAFQQPFGDAVTVPLLLLGRAAAEAGCTIVFNGEGGDQLFGGWANKPMIAAEMYQSPGYRREAAYMDTFHRFYGSEDRVLTPDFRESVRDIDVTSYPRPLITETAYPSLLHLLRAANLGLKGAQNIAPRAVQAGAYFNLKIESPFFDTDLCDWSFKLPASWLLRGACEKYLLKRVAAKYLPEAIVWREKRGMGVPVTEWCLGELKSDMQRALSRSRLQRYGLLNPDYVEALLRGEDAPGEFRRRRIGERIWTLLMLQLWLEENLPI